MNENTAKLCCQLEMLFDPLGNSCLSFCVLNQNSPKQFLPRTGSCPQYKNYYKYWNYLIYVKQSTQNRVSAQLKYILIFITSHILISQAKTSIKMQIDVDYWFHIWLNCVHKSYSMTTNYLYISICQCQFCWSCCSELSNPVWLFFLFLLWFLRHNITV